MRTLLILCLGFICCKTQAQTTFLKQQGFQINNKVLVTNYNFYHKDEIYSIWGLKDNPGGVMANDFRYVLSKYNLQGNFISNFEIQDSLSFFRLNNAHLFENEIFVFQINDLEIFGTNKDFISAYNINGEYIWNSNKSIQIIKTVFCNNHIFALGNFNFNDSIKFLIEFDLQSGLELISHSVDSILNLGNLDSSYQVVDFSYVGEKLVLLAKKNSNSKIILLDNNLEFITSFHVDSNANNLFSNYRNFFVNSITQFSTYITKSKLSFYDLQGSFQWDFTFNELDTNESFNISEVLNIKSDIFIVSQVYNQVTTNYYTKVVVLDSVGIYKSNFNLVNSTPTITAYKISKTPSGFFFQSPVGGGNSYYAYICAVDSCFNTNSSDFTVNLQNPDCFAPTEINENVILENTLSLFPNPTTSHFTIQSSSAIKSLTVYNLQGQQVLQKSNLNANSYTVEEQLPSGVYVVKVDTEAGVEVRKVLVGSDNGR